MDSKMKERIRFFAANAGYSVPPGRMACAKSLAEAEALAEEIGLTVTWETDQYPDLDFCIEKDRKDFEAGRFEILSAHIEGDGGEILASLGGIWIKPSDKSYRRVVEAELFQEALEEIRKGRIA